MANQNVVIVNDQNFESEVLKSDKPVLVDVVKDIAPMMVGGFIYPFSEFATPLPELSKRIGYQADPTAAVKEAKALMAAAASAVPAIRTHAAAIAASLPRPCWNMLEPPMSGPRRVRETPVEPHQT